MHPFVSVRGGRWILWGVGRKKMGGEMFFMQTE